MDMQRRIFLCFALVCFTLTAQSAWALSLAPCPAPERATELHVDTLVYLQQHPLLQNTAFSELSKNETYVLVHRNGAEDLAPLEAGDTVQLQSEQEESLDATVIVAGAQHSTASGGGFRGVILNINDPKDAFADGEWTIAWPVHAAPSDEQAAEVQHISVLKAFDAQAPSAALPVDIDARKETIEIYRQYYQGGALAREVIRAYVNVPSIWSETSAVADNQMYVIESRRRSDNEPRHIALGVGSSAHLNLTSSHCNGALSSDWLEHPKQHYRMWPASFPPDSSAEALADFTKAIAKVRKEEDKQRGCQSAGHPATSALLLLISALGLLAVRRRFA